MTLDAISFFTIYACKVIACGLRKSRDRSEAVPPPEINSARQIATNARGYSIPFGTKKPGQCFAAIAVTIVQRMRKAPTLVNKPKKSKMPPINSENAAAPSHSQAGFMKLKGAGIEIHFSKPGPLKLPNTFCAPWATNMVAMASRNGSRDPGCGGGDQSSKHDIASFQRN